VPGLDRAVLNALPMEKDTAVYRRIFEAGLGDYDVIIADLPPVVARATRTPAEILAPLAACDSVYLVCLTGETQRASIARCIDMCTIGAVKLSGVILNDWKMPVSSMLILETRKPLSPETQPEYGA
jgi:Mrp family chromosome partitioning ATPase